MGLDVAEGDGVDVGVTAAAVVATGVAVVVVASGDAVVTAATVVASGVVAVASSVTDNTNGVQVGVGVLVG